MAQEVEHVLGKDEVAGSNPAISSSEKPQDIVVFLRIKKDNHSLSEWKKSL